MIVTDDGLVPPELTDPSAREALLGPAGAAYGNKGIVIGSNGSLRKDCALGAAYAFKENLILASGIEV